MRKIILLATLFVAAVAISNCSEKQPPPKVSALSGAGASFPYPIYGQWAHKYGQTTGVQVNYQSIGSGGGIAQIKANTVNFGASDAPLKAGELDESDLIQFPMVIGGVVPVVNVPGIEAGKLKLTHELMAGIFMGSIAKWNDPAIAEANPELNLPDSAITVVHRADGSGTTWIFTNYLDKVSGDWRQKVGVGKAVSWPTGVGGKGNEGVANYVERVAGSIGYVEYAYAVQNKLAYALLKNRDGNFVAPTIETFQAAAANADWADAPGYYMVLTDQPGADSWPISGASFILIHKTQPSGESAKAMLKFFDWCFRFGGDMARQLHYVAIPQNVVEMVEESWKKDVVYNGQPVWP